MKMPFGKHKGEELADIPNDYLDWCLTNLDIRQPLRAAMENQIVLNRGEGINVLPLQRTRVVNIATTEQFDIYIGRPSKWGNPYVMNHASGNRDEVIEKFRLFFFSPTDRARRLRDEAKKELRGMILACYCKPLPCHGDVLADYVDGRLGEDGRATNNNQAK